MKKKILIALAVIFIGLQFMSTDKTLPDRDPGKDFFAIGNDQPEMAALIKTACYDCHSHETKYPGYTAIQPVGKWVQGHIETGRKNINFSEWADYSPEDQRHALKECAEVLEEKRMPLLPYMILHGDAWLSPEQRGDMAAYFKGRAAQL